MIFLLNKIFLLNDFNKNINKKRLFYILIIAFVYYTTSFNNINNLIKFAIIVINLNLYKKINTKSLLVYIENNEIIINSK